MFDSSLGEHFGVEDGDKSWQELGAVCLLYSIGCRAAEIDDFSFESVFFDEIRDVFPVQIDAGNFVFREIVERE